MRYSDITEADLATLAHLLPRRAADLVRVVGAADAAALLNALPGVVFVPLRSRHLQDLELSCLYRREDPSPVLAMFLEVVRAHGKSEKKGGRGRFRPA